MVILRNKCHIYEIRIKRFSGTGKAWYGIAWTSGDGIFWRLIREPIGDLLKQHAVSELIGNQQPSIEYNIVPEIGNLNLDLMLRGLHPRRKIMMFVGFPFKFGSYNLHD